MKKSIAMALVVTFLIGSLLGCAQKQTPTATTPSTGSTTAATTPATAEKKPMEGRTLHVLGSVRRFPGEDVAWTQVAKEFTDAYGANVVFNWTGERNALDKMITTAKLAGETVDIVSSGGNSVNSYLTRSGALMDMTQLLEPIRDRFSENMLNFYTVGGKVWGIPFGNCSTCMIYYNKDMFKELGISEPTTYEELLAISKIIKDKKKITPMVHSGKAAAFWPIWFMAAYAQTSGNKSLENITEFLSGKRQITGQEEKEAFKLIKKFFDDGIVSKESLDIDSAGMRAAFAQGQAAMFYGGAWENANVRKIVQDFEIGIFPFPLIVNNTNIKALVGGGPDDGLGIPAFAPQENLDMSMQFFEFITRPENVNTVLSYYQPSAVVVNGVKIEENEYNKTYNEKLAPVTIKFLDWIWPVEVNDTFKQMIPAVILGNVTPEEATSAIQKTYDTLIKEKDYSFDWWNKWSEADWAAVTPKSIPAYEVKK